MKAPDKIYLHPYATDGIYEVETRPSSDTIKYIRKDTLLEWARERLDFACALKSEGQKTVCKEFIDKIESL